MARVTGAAQLSDDQTAASCRSGQCLNTVSLPRYSALTGQQFLHVLAVLAAVGGATQVLSQPHHDRVVLEVFDGVLEPATGVRRARRQLQQHLTACDDTGTGSDVQAKTGRAIQRQKCKLQGVETYSIPVYAEQN